MHLYLQTVFSLSGEPIVVRKLMFDMTSSKEKSPLDLLNSSSSGLKGDCLLAEIQFWGRINLIMRIYK